MRSVASDLGLQRLPISHKKDGSVIFVEHMQTVQFLASVYTSKISNFCLFVFNVSPNNFKIISGPFRG